MSSFNTIYQIMNFSPIFQTNCPHMATYALIVHNTCFFLLQNTSLHIFHLTYIIVLILSKDYFLYCLQLLYCILKDTQTKSYINYIHILYLIFFFQSNIYNNVVIVILSPLSFNLFSHHCESFYITFVHSQHLYG